MKTFFGLASLALAAGQESLQDDVPSLLQLRATHDHRIAHNLTSSPKSGHSFGCTGRSTAQNVVQCGLWGDVHQHMSFQGNGHPDSYGTGWFWLAKSQDGQFQAQGHYRQSNPNHAHSWTTLSHFAFKFGDDVLFMDRDLDGPVEPGAWMWRYYWNGVEHSYTDAPDINPIPGNKVTWVNRGSGSMTNTAAHGLNFGNIMQAYDSRRHNCFEYNNVAVWVSFQNWQNPRSHYGPYGQCGIIEIEGAQNYLDTGFGQCAKAQQRVDPADMLVTQDQNQKVCNDDQLTADQCIHPPPPPPTAPTAEELCIDNNFPFASAQALCNGQLAAHGQDIYDGCVFDVCASADENTRQNAEGGAELEAAMGNSRATCLVKPFGGGNNNECKPCNICWDAVAVDLTQVTCNNLGGAGPDTNCPEEIRYKNAINLNRGAVDANAAGGRMVDVVMTVVGSYETPKPERNGNKGEFGRFAVATNTNSNFKFSFVDSNTGEAVIVPDIALTFYDMDEANNRLQREIVSSCEISEVYVTDMTELEHTTPTPNCHSFQSTVRGTGQDNPQSPDTLSMSQADRSVTFEYHARASIEFTAAITGDRFWPRPIMFSFLPQVACGASDSQSQCPARPARPQLVEFDASCDDRLTATPGAISGQGQMNWNTAANAALNVDQASDICGISFKCNTADGHSMLGLSSNMAARWQDINYGVTCRGSWGASTQIYEDGSQAYSLNVGRANNGNPASDVHAVRIVDGQVNYELNGAVYYTSARPVTYPWHVALDTYTSPSLSDVEYLQC